MKAIYEKKQLIGHLGRAGVKDFSEFGSIYFTDPQTIESGNGLRLQAE